MKEHGSPSVAITRCGGNGNHRREDITRRVALYTPATLLGRPEGTVFAMASQQAQHTPLLPAQKSKQTRPGGHEFGETGNDIDCLKMPDNDIATRSSPTLHTTRVSYPCPCFTLSWPDSGRLTAFPTWIRSFVYRVRI